MRGKERDNYIGGKTWNSYRSIRQFPRPTLVYSRVETIDRYAIIRVIPDEFEQM